MENIDCIVVVPTHKSFLDGEEEKSLLNTLKILGKWDICILCPDNIDTFYYEAVIQGVQASAYIKSVDSKNFGTIHRYNRMMLGSDIYKMFHAYDYMLICHVDAWVFKDQLRHWISLDYDYIGAPWCIDSRNPLSGTGKMFMPYGGNGGFCLRRISKMIELTEWRRLSKINYRTFFKYFVRLCFHLKLKSLYGFLSRIRLAKQKEEIWDGELLPEDLIFSEIIPCFSNDYNVAPAENELSFALELQAEYIHEHYLKELPFGCHDYKRHWKEIDRYKKKEMLLS